MWYDPSSFSPSWCWKYLGNHHLRVWAENITRTPFILHTKHSQPFHWPGFWLEAGCFGEWPPGPLCGLQSVSLTLAATQDACSGVWERGKDQYFYIPRYREHRRLTAFQLPEWSRAGSFPCIPSRPAARWDEGSSSVRGLLLCPVLYWVLGCSHLDRLLDGECWWLPGGKKSATSFSHPSPSTFSQSLPASQCSLGLMVIANMGWSTLYLLLTESSHFHTLSPCS